MSLILQILQNQSQLSTIKYSARTISNCLHGHPIPTTVDQQLIGNILLTLSQLIYNLDEEVLSDTACAIFNYSNLNEKRMKQVIESGICRRLAELLKHSNICIVESILGIFRNFSSSKDDKYVNIQIMINISVLPSLLQLMSHKKIFLRREACKIVSNICCGNREQIQSVIKENIIPVVIMILSDGKEDYRIKMEAMSILYNLFVNGNQDQVDHVVIKLGCLPSIIDVLESDDCKNNNKLLTIILESIKYLLDLSCDSDINHLYLQYLKDCEGFEKIEFYSNFNNIDISNLVNEILEYKNNEDMD
ncbi:hypothetical protein ABK040_016897 [Willaertia magna]